ncbi:MAG: flagellar biosynthesis anti-sigma factor FlgM [Phycisphaerales bacterium]|nr:flagellar biosynthesis anti-sigma factor FlgM [Phycisphaerales bacterium]
MSYISPTNTNAAAGVGRVGAVRSEQVSRPDATLDDTRTRPTRSKDQVELSQVARHLSVLKSGIPERSELIARVRQEIDAGQYDTPEKLEAAIDGVKEDLEFTL